jgi:hypothetical protein
MVVLLCALSTIYDLKMKADGKSKRVLSSKIFVVLSYKNSFSRVLLRKQVSAGENGAKECNNFFGNKLLTRCNSSRSVASHVFTREKCPGLAQHRRQPQRHSDGAWNSHVQCPRADGNVSKNQIYSRPSAFPMIYLLIFISQCNSSVDTSR